MRLSVKILATAAFAALLVPAPLLRAAEAVKPSAGARADKAEDSGLAAVAGPAAPMLTSSTAATTRYKSRVSGVTPRAELFMGYSYLRAVPSLNTGNRLMWLNGGSTSIAFNLNRYFGLVGDFGGLNATRILITTGNPPGAEGSVKAVDSGYVFSYLVGPRLSFRKSERVTPFVQALFGDIRAREETVWPRRVPSLPTQNAFALTAGAGLDVKVRHNLAIRVVQAEYLMTDFEDLAAGEKATQDDVRLSSGLVFRFGGGPPPPPVTLACVASPASIFPGDPVILTATAGQLDPRLNAAYSWTGSGVTGNGTTATVSTSSLTPGRYTVNCGVKEGKPGKEGLRHWETADALASFTVKAYEPPTISCSASPSTINLGDKAVITAIGTSPQNRPLTYTYSASAGTINGHGTTASFDSAGVTSSAITATCAISDDRNQTATSSVEMTIASPPPPAPSAQPVRIEARPVLHSVFFPTAQPAVEHPEGGLLASQQKALITLATDFKSYLTFKPDAHLTLSGHADVRGSVDHNQALSERRVARTKQFLVEQGIPEASVETRGLGKEQELTPGEVKELVEQNPDLGDAERKKVLGDLTVITLAQNRRVDITLSTTGQESLRLYPFSAADSITLLEKKRPTPKKKAVTAPK